MRFDRGGEKQGTLEIILTSPHLDAGFVLAKFVARCPPRLPAGAYPRYLVIISSTAGRLRGRSPAATSGSSWWRGDLLDRHFRQLALLQPGDAGPSHVAVALLLIMAQLIAASSPKEAWAVRC